MGEVAKICSKSFDLLVGLRDANGHAAGFHIDLMRAVCQRAGKNCYFVVDTYHNCWNTRGGQELPGTGK